MTDAHQAGLVLWQMVETSRIFQTAGQRDKEQGFAGTKFGFLQYLRHHDARLSELANEFRVSAPVASRTVHCMEDDGLVLREVDPHDARAQLISITDYGREKLHTSEQRVVNDFASALADWSPNEATQVIQLLERLNGHLRDVTQAQTPSTTTRK